MRVYSTLTGQKEEFPAPGSPVTMYVCGVTPYDRSHLGHAMSAIVFDVVRRYLEFRGYEVRHVVNFTDVDDKLIARADRLGITTKELADQVIAQFFGDIDALNVVRAHHYPRVTEEIDSIVDLVRRLEERGFAYASGGDVYYRVHAFSDYGKLSHRTIEGMMAGARIDVDDAKEHPMDFVLWKGAKPGEPAWDSPWGPGRPGWHIECSAMSLRYLGDQLVIHGGGQDLVFPHHENEIAQSEAATGVVPFARFWMHNGLLRMGEEKMSKSLGNLIGIREALDSYGADAVRLFVLSSLYRSPLTYSEEGLQSWTRAAARLRDAVNVADRDLTSGTVDAAPYRQRFLDAMDDDFNSPQALAALFDLVREINRGAESGASTGEARATLAELAGVLGLTLRSEDEGGMAAAPFIDLLVQVRTELRTAKAWALADHIRNGLTELGVTLEDSAGGTTWKRRE